MMPLTISRDRVKAFGPAFGKRAEEKDDQRQHHQRNQEQQPAHALHDSPCRTLVDNISEVEKTRNDRDPAGQLDVVDGQDFRHLIDNYHKPAQQYRPTDYPFFPGTVGFDCIQNGINRIRG